MTWDKGANNRDKQIIEIKVRIKIYKSANNRDKVANNRDKSAKYNFPYWSWRQKNDTEVLLYCA